MNIVDITRIMEYGIVKELDDGNTIWFEPITDEIDGFVVRDSNSGIVSVYQNIDNKDIKIVYEGEPMEEHTAASRLANLVLQRGKYDD